MSRVRIIRGNEAFCRFSQMEVFIDDSNVGSVSFQDYKDFSVTSGSHTMYVKIGGYTSITININVESSKPTIFSVKLPKFTLNPFQVAINIFGGKSNIDFTPMSTDYRAEKYS